jgi:hypothetical protein
MLFFCSTLCFTAGSGVEVGPPPVNTRAYVFHGSCSGTTICPLPLAKQ